MSVLLKKYINILPSDWNKNQVYFRYCLVSNCFIFSFISFYIKPHQFVKSPDCFLFPYFSWTIYWMLQMKQVHLFHAFTFNILNKIECFHHFYTQHFIFFFMKITKKIMLALLKLDGCDWLWLFISPQA